MRRVERIRNVERQYFRSSALQARNDFDIMGRELIGMRKKSGVLMNCGFDGFIVTQRHNCASWNLLQGIFQLRGRKCLSLCTGQHAPQKICLSMSCVFAVNELLGWSQ